MTDYERFGDYQPAERSNLGVALTFLFIGLGVGTAVALLLAPKSGRQMRRTLRRRYEDARDVIDDWTDQGRDVIGKGRDVIGKGADWASTAKEKVAPIARAAAKKASNLRD